MSFHLFLEWVKLGKSNVRLIDKSSSRPREVTQHGSKHEVTFQAKSQVQHELFFLLCSVVLCLAVTLLNYFCNWQLICSPKAVSWGYFSKSLQVNQHIGVTCCHGQGNTWIIMSEYYSLELITPSASNLSVQDRKILHLRIYYEE